MSNHEDELASLQILLDDAFLDDIPAPQSFEPTVPFPKPDITPSTSSTTATHDYALAIPIDQWEHLKRTAPYRGIKAFVLQAITEKLAQPHLPDLIIAAKALLRIAEELLLTADNPPANADRVLSELQDALKHFG